MTTHLPAWCCICKSWMYVEDVATHVGDYHGIAAVEVSAVDIRSDQRVESLLQFTRDGSASELAKARIKSYLVDGKKPVNSHCGVKFCNGEAF